MPHDREGHEVKPGDRVLVECVVKSVQAGEEYCNVTLETVSAMPPYETGTSITLNTKQTKLVAK